MKRLGIVLVMFLCVGMLSNTYAQKDRKLSNGFSVNLVTGFPSDIYGVESTDDIDNEFKLGTLWGLQLGNRWYFNPKEKYGIGLMVNWVDFTMSAKGGSSDFGFDWGRAVLDMTFLEVGPVGTLAVNDDIAIDGYYNLRPTVLTSAFVMSDPSGSASDETYAYAGFGFSHAIGAAFRWKVLNVGMEYVMGGIKSTGTYTGDQQDVTLDDSKNKANSFRIMLGVKF